MNAVDLNYKIIGAGKPFVILHGLFGSLDNWQTHAKTLSNYFQVILVDARNHGHSPHTDNYSYDLMAEDLHRLFQNLDITKAHVLGHSMGGKAVMRFAQLYPDLVEKLYVIDMGIKSYPLHHELILKSLNAVSAAKPSSRKLAQDIISEYVSDQSVQQFLLKNLYWVIPGKELDWRMNVIVLEKEMSEILQEIPKAPDCDMPTLFVRGGLSNYILDEDFDDIDALFHQATMSTIEGAGHWVHAEKVDEFLDVVLRFALF